MKFNFKKKDDKMKKVIERSIIHLYTLDSHAILNQFKINQDYKIINAEALIYSVYYIEDDMNSDFIHYIYNVSNTRLIVDTLKLDNEKISLLIKGSLYDIKSMLYSFDFNNEYKSSGEGLFYTNIIRDAIYKTPITFSRDLINRNILKESNFIYINEFKSFEYIKSPIFFTSHGIIHKAVQEEYFILNILDNNLKASTFDLFINMDDTILANFINRISSFLRFDKIFITDSVNVWRISGIELKRFISFLSMPNMVLVGDEANEFNFKEIENYLVNELIGYGLSIFEKVEENNEEYDLYDEVGEDIGEIEEEEIDISEAVE